MISSDDLLKAVANGLEVDLSDINMETKASELSDWDSLGHFS